MQFKQYLETTDIPSFRYRIKNKAFHYKWSNCVNDFDMSLKVFIDGKPTWLQPDTNWKTININKKTVSVKVDENFLVNTKL